MVSVLKNFVERLDNDTLNFIHDRFNDRLQGDLYDVLKMIDLSYKDIDKWLQSAKSSDDLFEMIDLISDAVVAETGRRTK